MIVSRLKNHVIKFLETDLFGYIVLVSCRLDFPSQNQPSRKPTSFHNIYTYIYTSRACPLNSKYRNAKFWSFDEKLAANLWDPLSKLSWTSGSQLADDLRLSLQRLRGFGLWSCRWSEQNKLKPCIRKISAFLFWRPPSGISIPPDHCSWVWGTYSNMLCGNSIEHWHLYLLQDSESIVLIDWVEHVSLDTPKFVWSKECSWLVCLVSKWNSASSDKLLWRDDLRIQNSPEILVILRSPQIRVLLVMFVLCQFARSASLARCVAARGGS